MFKKMNQFFTDPVGMSSERKFDAMSIRKMIDNERETGILRVFDEECGLSLLQCPGGNFGQLERGIDVDLCAVELAVAFKDVKKFPEGHTPYSSSSARQPRDSRRPSTPRSLSV